MSMRALLTVFAGLFLFTGCDLFGGGGGGGTGGGAGGGGMVDVDFHSGFVFVRRDDRNVYLTDDADTSTVATLTSGAMVKNPSLSKDATRVVYVQGTGSTGVLATVAITGGAPSTVLTASDSVRNLRNPVFSADASRIAFTFDDGSGARTGLVNADGSGFQTLATGGLSQISPTFTADGAALIVASGPFGMDATQLERIDLSTNQVTNVTNTLGNEALGIANRVVVSPDGAHAVFDARVSSDAVRLFTIDLTSKVVTRLYAGENGANDTFPCWKSNQTVAFSSDVGGNDNVYSVDLPTSDSPTLLVPKALEPWYGP